MVAKYVNRQNAKLLTVNALLLSLAFLAAIPLQRQCIVKRADLGLADYSTFKRLIGKMRPLLVW